LFDVFSARPDVQVVPITKAVFDRATVLRATHNFKLADSLHLAAAVEARCDRLLTNDTRLSAFTDVPVEVSPCATSGGTQPCGSMPAPPNGLPLFERANKPSIFFRGASAQIPCSLPRIELR